jgi:hypothetical protein
LLRAVAPEQAWLGAPRLADQATRARGWLRPTAPSSPPRAEAAKQQHHQQQQQQQQQPRPQQQQQQQQQLPLLPRVLLGGDGSGGAGMQDFPSGALDLVQHLNLDGIILQKRVRAGLFGGSMRPS